MRTQLSITRRRRSVRSYVLVSKPKSSVSCALLFRSMREDACWAPTQAHALTANSIATDHVRFGSLAD